MFLPYAQLFIEGLLLLSLRDKLVVIAQLVPTPDWEKDLPMELLALVARLGGQDEMKAMRGVCKEWQQGFEWGTTGLTVQRNGPVLMVDWNHFERFQRLASLHLGDSYVAEADLKPLSSLKQLQTLSLGTQSNSSNPKWFAGALFSCLTGSCFRFLEGLNITDLNLRACTRVVPAELAFLRGLPLSRLDFSGCSGHFSKMQISLVRRSDCKFLLAILGLSGLQNQSVLEAFANTPFTSLDLSEYPFKYLDGERIHFLRVSGKLCSKFTGAGLEYLKGAPLTSLKMSGCDRLQDPYLRFLKDMPLSVSGCSSLTDAGVGLLRGLKIQDLNLTKCVKLTNESLSHLVDMPLSRLSLNRCRKISRDGLKHLLGLPLTRLDLRKCPRLLEDDIIQHLVKLPELELLELLYI